MASAEVVDENKDQRVVPLEHKVIATFQGVYESTRSFLPNPPIPINAEFKITDYLHYKKIAQGDRPKRESYHIQIASVSIDADEVRRKRIEELIGIPLTTPEETAPSVVLSENIHSLSSIRCDPSLLAYLKTLEKGDKVVIEWKDLFGLYRAGTTGINGPQETILLLKKISQVEAKQLTTDAASAEPAQH